MTGRFEHKVAIVTGAARGMGASYSLAFAREGADVVVADICHDLPLVPYATGTQGEMNDVVGEVQRLGRRAIGVRCDVSKAEDVQNMVQRAVDELGKIDILVNNAGIAFVRTPVWEVSEEQWKLMVDVMFKGTFLCCKYVLPHMIGQRYGKIVNVSSIGARGHPKNAVYSATKAGIEILTLAMAKDVGEYNINVNCVAPGLVLTPMVRGNAKALDRGSAVQVDEAYALMCKQYHILGREILPQDLSNAVVFLCSEEARNVNGHTLYVDGGFLGI